MSGIKELKGRTIITGAVGSGKSTLLTAIAQTLMEENLQGAMLYYGTSESYEKYAAEKRGDPRCRFLPVYQFPFNKNSPGVAGMINAIKNIRQSSPELLIAVDEAHNLFASPAPAAEFLQALSGLSSAENNRLNLVMTAPTTDGFSQMFGSEFLTTFDNHLILKNQRQPFYEPVIISDLIEQGKAIPLIRGERQPPFFFESGKPETVCQPPLPQPLPQPLSQPPPAAGILKRLLGY